jgi:RimJ/RimL family protein N-acetyltransferase
METNRIILRPWRDSDAEVLYKWASDPDVGPRAGWTPHQSVEIRIAIKSKQDDSVAEHHNAA